MDHLCFFCLVCLFVDALWSPAGKGLTSWLSFVMSNCDASTFPFGILGQVWCLIVPIPDLWPLKEKTQIDFQYRLSLNAGQKYCIFAPREHSAILLTFIKL